MRTTGVVRDRWGRHRLGVLIIILVFVVVMTRLNADPLLAATVALGVMAVVGEDLPLDSVLRQLHRAWPDVLGGGSAV